MRLHRDYDAELGLGAEHEEVGVADLVEGEDLVDRADAVLDSKLEGIGSIAGITGGPADDLMGMRGGKKKRWRKDHPI